MKTNNKKKTTIRPTTPFERRRPRRGPEWASYWPLGCPLPDTAAYECLPWPAVVPLLVKSDLVKTHVIPLQRPPYALDGWLEATFGDSGHVADIALIALTDEVSRWLNRPTAVWEFLLVPGVKRAAAVVVWKNAMELLGYDMTKAIKPVDPYEEFFS